MNNIGSNIITARPPSSPTMGDQPANDIQDLLQRLRDIKNCCNHCGSHWQQWQKKVDGMLKEITGKNDGGIHPCLFILRGMESLRTLEQRMITEEDAGRLKNMGYEPAGAEAAGLPERAKSRGAALMDMCNDTNCDDKRAAIHLYFSQAMAKVLTYEIKPRLREAISRRNRGYDPAIDSLYPLRDIQGNPIIISSIANISLNTESGKKYARAAIEPFISPHLNGTERQMLYQSLKCRKLGKADLLPHETALIGQWGVIAATNLPEESCIGVFSGTLVSAKEMGDNELFEHNYIVDISIKGQPTNYLDSDGILSKINTTFAYDEHGEPVCQAELGYNVEMVKFRASLDNGRRINLVALFTTGYILAGTELRRNHYLSKTQVASLFRPPHPDLF